MDDSRLHADCPASPVVSSEVGAVGICRGCGVVHLQLQYLPLRFEADAFRDLARLVGQAQQRIERQSADSPMQQPAATGPSGWH